MRQLTDLLNKISGMAQAAGVPQPDLRIVTLGEQGCGKSTLLKTMFDLEWLPTGEGGRTTRPIIVSLTNTPTSQDQQQTNTEWYELSHIPGRQYTRDDMKELRAEIMASLIRSTSLSDPIRVRFCSPKVGTISLVDLPGYVPSDPSQSHSREIEQFVRDSNSIILAFVSAASSQAQFQSLEIVKQHNAQDRVITVMTWLDGMASSNSGFASSLLLGRFPTYPHPCVAIPAAHALSLAESEAGRGKLLQDWFGVQHSDSQAWIKARVGPQHLDNLIAQAVHRLFRQFAPMLKVRITSRLSDATRHKNELELKWQPPSDELQYKSRLMTMIGELSKNFNSFLHGGRCDSLHASQLVGGARIVRLIEDFVRELGELSSLQDLSSEEIAVAVKNSNGTGTTILIPQQCFETLVGRQIMLMEPIAMHALIHVKAEIAILFDNSVPKDLDYMPELRRFIVDKLDCLLDKETSTTRDMIKKVFEMETARINVSHPDFMRVYENMFRGPMNQAASPTDEPVSSHPEPPQIEVQVPQDRKPRPTTARPPNQTILDDLMSPPSSSRARSPSPSPLPRSDSAGGKSNDNNNNNNNNNNNKIVVEIEGGRVMAGAGAAGLLAGAMVAGPALGVAAGLGTAAMVLRGDGYGSAARSAGRMTVEAYEASNQAWRLGSRASQKAATWASSVGTSMSQSLAQMQMSEVNEKRIPHSKLNVPTPQLLLSTHQRACQIVASLIDIYFGVVRTKLQDMIPKILFAFTVNPISKNMEMLLLHTVLSSPLGRLSSAPGASTVASAKSSIPSNRSHIESASTQQQDLIREIARLEDALKLLDSVKQTPIK